MTALEAAASMPPLTDEQVQKIAALLSLAGVVAAEVKREMRQALEQARDEEVAR